MEFHLEDSIVYLITSTARLIRKRLIQEFHQAGFHISSEQWSILIHLWNRDRQYQFELAEVLNKDKTTITRLINELENKELVARQTNQFDRRLNHICLTRKGKHLQGELIPIAETILAEIDQNIGVKKIEVCRDILRQMKAMFER